MGPMDTNGLYEIPERDVNAASMPFDCGQHMWRRELNNHRVAGTHSIQTILLLSYSSMDVDHQYIAIATLCTLKILFSWDAKCE
jgi:hypothetical protein